MSFQIFKPYLSDKEAIFGGYNLFQSMIDWKDPEYTPICDIRFFFGWLNRCMCIYMCNAIISVRHVLSLSHFSNGETSGQIIQPEFDDLDSPPASLTLEGTYRAGSYGLKQDDTVSFFLISLPGIGNYDLSSAEKNRYNIMSILKKLFEIKNSQTFADFLRLVNVI